MEKKKTEIPVCRVCRNYDRFRNCCREDRSVKILNGVPQNPCPLGRGLEKKKGEEDE